MSTPLVSGGVLGETRYTLSTAPPTHFITHTLPVIFENARIVAASHPNVKKGHPNDDGWFLSDFYAFNYLLKGSGSSQTWLTAADPWKLLRSDPPKTDKYLHGNPYQDRKVVLSEELLANGELIPVTVVKNTEMISRFLKEVRHQSEKAKRQNAPLVLFLFCHGLENFSFLLDCGQKKGLTLNQIKEAIEPGCRVTLISTACYSSGWAVRSLNNPDNAPLDATILAAADPDCPSNSWQASRRFGSISGSIFASSVIEALTSTTSPLLHDKPNDTSDERPLQSNEPTPLQPDDPTPQQTETYNAFCQEILDVCKDRVTRLWYFQTFTFSAQNDQWDYSWTGRTGIPLLHFENRWNALDTVPYTGSTQDKLNMDPDPTNPSFQGSAGSSKTGGEAMIDEMTRHICQNRVSHMARLFLQTCPGDWDCGWGPLMHGTLLRATERELPMEDLNEISATICFQWELALYADHLVETFGLPVPYGEICILWESRRWQLESEKYKLHKLIRQLFIFGNFTPYPGDNQGPPFDRFTRYMAAAVTLADLPEDETRDLVKRLIEYMANVKAFQSQRAMAERGTLQRARSWFKEIGKKMRAFQ